MVPTLSIGKWTVKVMYALGEGPHRNGQLRRRLGGVSQRMLTRTLRNLEAAGVVARQVTGSKVVAVEYSLTKLGPAFLTPLESMCDWASLHEKEMNVKVHLSKELTKLAKH
jgi:DNA-binding HxlR family transcriptional regulator